MFQVCGRTRSVVSVSYAWFERRAANTIALPTRTYLLMHKESYLEETSSQTPEGTPHRCRICKKSFLVSRSITGDACCPNCNALIWPKGVEKGQRETGERVVRTRPKRPKRIRLRVNISDQDLEIKRRQAVKFLNAKRTVSIMVLTRRRTGPHIDGDQFVLDRFLDKSILARGRISQQPQRRGRTLVCTLVPR